MEYVAISYAWDRDQLSEKNCVMIDGKGIVVSAHVYQLLVEVRNQALKTPDQPRFIWIDSICINQGNTREKAHQVNLMRDVYQSAKFVFSWLGPADYYTDVAMDALRGLTQHVWEAVDPTGRLSPQQMRAVLTREYDSLLEEEAEPLKHLYDHRSLRFDSPHWTPIGLALMSLFQRRYWTRMWIVQEVMLARKIWVLCGSKRIKWEELETLFSELRALGGRVSALAYSMRWIILTKSHAAQLVFERQQARSDSSGADGAGIAKRPLRCLLERFGLGWDCQDPRDKVYGLVGLSSNKIVVDYEKSPQEVCAEALYLACLGGELADHEKFEDYRGLLLAALGVPRNSCVFNMMYGSSLTLWNSIQLHHNGETNHHEIPGDTRVPVDPFGNLYKDPQHPLGYPTRRDDVIYHPAMLSGRQTACAVAPPHRYILTPVRYAITAMDIYPIFRKLEQKMLPDIG